MNSVSPAVDCLLCDASKHVLVCSIYEIQMLQTSTCLLAPYDKLCQKQHFAAVPKLRTEALHFLI